jgi:hypothetical protein
LWLACGACAGTEETLVAAAPEAPPVAVRARRAETRHFRTKSGSVLVYTPTGYDPAKAGIVVYVHGYYTDAARAWKEHRLDRQFADSNRNAVFIAPEAPRGPRDPVAFSDLSRLLRIVERGLRQSLPRGPIVVVGHSGAYRTLARWLEHPRVRTIVLLDACYEDPQGFARWLELDPARRLILVTVHTLSLSEALLARFPFAVRREGIPDRYYPPFSQEERRARLLYILSQFDHFGLVEEGAVIPLLLEICDLADIPRERPRLPWQ